MASYAEELSRRRMCGAYLYYRTFDFLEIGDHLEEVSCLRIPLRAEHTHKTLWRSTESRAELQKSYRAVDVFAEYDFPGLNITRDHAGDSFTEKRTAKLRACFKVCLYRLAKAACICHHFTRFPFVRLYSCQRT